MRAPGGPRLLLRRLREVMAEPVTAQARLDRIVVLIASNMVAEVCSLYVARADGPLELYATEGLNREAVHLTTMMPGEGLVGLIAATAEPLALSDAQNHPAFSYKPETGEEIYQSFLGVPVLRGGATLGVLVVQNRARRTYSEEEIEALQTTAMLLAEMIVSGELQSITGQGAPIAARRPESLIGQPIAEGLGLGHVVLHQPRVAVAKIVADDISMELDRLEKAIEAMRASVDALIDRSDDGRSGEHREVLEAFRMIAHDRGWLRRLREAVASGLTAEAAVERVQNDARARLQRQTDPYLRDRLHDLTDIANRLLHQLAGQSLVLLPSELPENAILVARSMSPAALLDYDRARLRGVVLEEAGASSHVAIVARALAIPAVSDVPNITEIVEQGDAIIVDGVTGEVQVRPQPDIEAAYAEKARLRARRQDQYRALRDAPSATADGVTIGLHMNAGLLIDMPHLDETGAESIGLFRTELQFMLANSFPRIDAQESIYRAVLDAAGGHVVTFRTLDIGGDKMLPYMKRLDEANPALGWRAIRMGLDRPGLLRTQLRAMLRAAAGRELKVMIPMVSTVAEFLAARALFDKEIAFVKRCGREPPRDIKLGAMVEVPSLLWEIEEIAEAADFLSVGSNDLMQYVFAADRVNKRVAGRFDELSPSFLRALKSIADAGARHRTPVTLCGEMGGRPLSAMALIALGFRNFSMAATAIGPVKAMVVSLDAGAAARELQALLDARIIPARCARRCRRSPSASPSASSASPAASRRFPPSTSHDRHREFRHHPAPLRGDRRPTQRRRDRRGRLCARCRANSPSSSRWSAAIRAWRDKEKERADLDALLAEPGLDPEMRSLAEADRARVDADARTDGARDPARAAAEGRRRRGQRHSRGAGGNRRRRGGAVRRRPVPHVRQIRRVEGLEGRGFVGERGNRRRLQGNRRRDRRPRRLRAAEIRERRPPRPARAGDRGAGAHPHLGGDGRGAAGG